MRKAFDLGCALYDTAEAYSAYANEEFVGKAFKPIRDKVESAPRFCPGRKFPRAN